MARARRSCARRAKSAPRAEAGAGNAALSCETEWRGACKRALSVSMRLCAAALSALFLLSPRPASAGPRNADDHFIDDSGKTVAFHPVYEGWFGSDRYRP